MKNVNNLASYYMNLNPNFCLSSSINCVNNEPEITLMETDYFILNSNDIQIESNQLNTSFPFITLLPQVFAPSCTKAYTQATQTLKASSKRK